MKIAYSKIVEIGKCANKEEKNEENQQNYSVKMACLKRMMIKKSSQNILSLDDSLCKLKKKTHSHKLAINLMFQLAKIQ